MLTPEKLTDAITTLNAIIDQLGHMLRRLEPDNKPGDSEIARNLLRAQETIASSIALLLVVGHLEGYNVARDASGAYQITRKESVHGTP